MNQNELLQFFKDHPGQFFTVGQLRGLLGSVSYPKLYGLTRFRFIRRIDLGGRKGYGFGYEE